MVNEHSPHYCNNPLVGRNATVIMLISTRTTNGAQAAAPCTDQTKSAFIPMTPCPKDNASLLPTGTSFPNPTRCLGGVEGRSRSPSAGLVLRARALSYAGCKNSGPLSFFYVSGFRKCLPLSTEM